MTEATAIQETAWSLRELPPTPPLEETIEATAHRLMALTDDTQRRILYAVAAGAKRFKDLKEQSGKPDGQLTRALAALYDEGLIVERVMAREEPIVKKHDLAPRGALVLNLMQTFHEVAAGAPLEVETPTDRYVLYCRVEGKGDRRHRLYFFAKKGRTPKNAWPTPAPSKGRIVITSGGTPELSRKR